MLLASLLDLGNPAYLLANPLSLLIFGFQLWMFVDAIRRQEWIWALFIIIGWGLSALFYYLMVYRQEGPAGGGLRGFELPGAQGRRRIKELQSRIHHLDHARDHLDLADVYFSQGKLAKAEASYRAALERDPSDLDAIAHLGQCLLRLKRTAEAKPLLAQVVAADPRHDYSHTMMALAECQTLLGETDAALASWRQVLASNSYARARVQYAELLLARNEREAARRELQETIDDDAHSPKFQRGKDRVWIKRAQRLLASSAAA